MKKSYLFISILTYTFIFLLAIVFLLNNNSVVYATIVSIIVPITFGFLIDYDKKQKYLLKEYYTPLYFYVRVYFDILSQSNEMLKLGEKHGMIDKLSFDVVEFLNNNLKYVSPSLSEKLEFIVFNKYRNDNNEFQRNYDLIGIMPIIMKEMNELYKSLNVEQLLISKSYIRQNRYCKYNGLKILYCQSFILNVAKRVDVVQSIGETMLFYLEFQKYIDKNSDKLFRLYKYCIDNNYNINYKKIVKELKEQYNFGIKKNKRKKI